MEEEEDGFSETVPSGPGTTLSEVRMVQLELAGSWTTPETRLALSCSQHLEEKHKFAGLTTSAGKKGCACTLEICHGRDYV